MPPMSAKQIRYFGTKAQKAALRRKRGGSSKPSPSRRKARTTRRTRPTMPRKKTSKPRKAKTAWLTMAANANTAIQLLEPLAPAIEKVMQETPDYKGAVADLKPALKEIASPRNVAQVGFGYGVRGLIGKGLKALGAKNPKIGNRRVF